MLKLTLLQTDILWGDKKENLRRLHEKLQALRGTTEIVVLPEAFSTGFNVECTELAEPTDGETITTLRRWAAEYQLALAGSYIAREGEHCYNRGFFLTPEGDAWFIDKRHLFRMGGEDKFFVPGGERTVIPYRGWNIRLLVCYDLRFPVWARNVENEYDLLLCVANWPAARRLVWDVLLQARALENQCYVCGVNRIGTDAYGIPHNGGSVVYNHKGKLLASVADETEDTATAELDLTALNTFRRKFPVWRDADTFRIDR